MKCGKCGKALKSNEKFCTYCGYYNEEEEKQEESINIDNSDDDNWYDEELDSNNEDDDVLFAPVKKEKKKKEKIEEPQEEFKIEEPKEKKVKVKVEKPKKEKKVKEVKIKEDNEVYDENEKYIEAYIGEDYKIIKKSPFNIWAFLLNWMYFLYRKLYITGIIGLIITALVAFFFTEYFLIYAIVTLVVLGIGFNPYYSLVVKGRVNKILNDYEGSDSFSLEQLCREFGGVNVAMALIIYFIFLVVIVLSIVKPSFEVQRNSAFWKENSENEANCTSLVKLIYQETKTNQKIDEALCKINKTNKNYDVYLKTSKDDKVIYVYYTTEKDYIVYKNSTDSIDSFIKKQEENKLTPEETTNLNDMKLIISNYESIRNKSLEEDKLIEANKNKEEKLNYIFKREEIIR